MKFDKLKKTATGGTAVAEPKTVDAEVVKESPLPHGVEAKSDRASALSVFDAEAETSGMRAIIARDDQRDLSYMLFPEIRVKDGIYQISDDLPGEVADLLPQGKKPISAVFLGYRLVVTAWPKKYDPAAEQARPVFSGAVSGTDADLSDLVTAACKKYQFTKKDKKDAFDYDEATKEGTGHPRPTIEFLVWLPNVGLAVIRNADGYSGMARSVASALAALPDSKIKPTPMLFTPVTTPVKTPAYSWDEYHINCKGIDLRDPVAVDLGRQYEAWKQTATQDEELVAKFTKWKNCEDKPLDEESVARLRAVLA